MINWQEEIINAKYHLSIARRLYQNYSKFPEKRLLVGVINELAKSTSRLIKAYLIQSKKKRLKDFTEIISKQYLDEITSENLMKTLEIQKAQKTSPIQFTKGNKIILLIEGKYRFIKMERLGELINSVNEGISRFPSKIRQI